MGVIGWDGRMRLPARLSRLRRRTSAISAEVATSELLSAVPEPVVPPPLRTPRPAAWWIVPAALLVGGAASGVAWWLLSTLPPLPTSAEEATARQGAIQTALALAAGIGAAITLMLAFRRQRHQEHAAHVTAYLTERNARLAEQVAEHNRQDATERRVTELYTKAVEQLGHTTAAVRLGGLYALERLAQDNPDHRQTIVNVICAYLRMPYTPPSDSAQQGSVHAVLRATVAGVSTPATGHDPHEERQVRLTAQRILVDHSHDNRTPEQREMELAGPRFWEGMRIDLNGATLIDLDLTGCHLTDAQFGEAIFEGDFRINGVAFEGGVRFDGATFKKSAWFENITFRGNANFGWVAFRGSAWFTKAVFMSDVNFTQATFARNASFAKATFMKRASFFLATFTQEVRFGGATFTGDANFSRATFMKGVWFSGEPSKGIAGARIIPGAVFKRNAEFGEATFARDVRFRGVTFEGIVWFGKATFAQAPRFEDVRIVRPDGEHVWPVNWVLVRREDGSGLLQESNAEPPPSPIAAAEDK